MSFAPPEKPPMSIRRLNTVTIAMLLGLSLFLLQIAALTACDPATTRNSNESEGVRVVYPPGSPQPGPTPVTIYALNPGDDPFGTPIPGLTRTPTNTPRPTLIPDSPEAYAEIAAYSATKVAEATREAITETYYEDSLAVQIEKFTRYNRGGRKFDAIVRAKVTGHRYVEPNLDIEWPDEAGNPPFPSTTIDEKETYTSWRRIKLQI